MLGDNVLVIINIGQDRRLCHLRLFEILRKEEVCVYTCGVRVYVRARVCMLVFHKYNL